MAATAGTIIAQGQITIVDYNDAISYNAYIGSNQPLTQIYTPDAAGNKFNPDWITTTLVLTPQLFAAGNGAELISTDAAHVKSVTWTSNKVAIENTTDHVKSSTAPFALTISINDLDTNPQKNYECTIVYTEQTTQRDVTVQAAISFVKVTNSTGTITAQIYAPNGTTFNNADASQKLVVHCDLWRGSSIDADKVTYYWYILDPTIVTVDSNTGIGPGWGLITSSKNYGGIKDKNGSTSYTTSNELQIPATAVLDILTVQCAIKDTDATSSTYGKCAAAMIDITDKTDPIQVDIDSPSGTVIKNGDTNPLVLTCNLYRSLAELDPLQPVGVSQIYEYRWYKMDKDGIEVTGWGGTGINYKLGKQLTITIADVSMKSTFRVKVLQR